MSGMRKENEEGGVEISLFSVDTNMDEEEKRIFEEDEAARET